MTATTHTAESLATALNAFYAVGHTADDDPFGEVVDGHPAYDAAASERLSHPMEFATSDGRMVAWDGPAGRWAAYDMPAEV